MRHHIICITDHLHAMVMLLPVIWALWCHLKDLVKHCAKLLHDSRNKLLRQQCATPVQVYCTVSW